MILMLSVELVSFVFDSLAHKILGGGILVFPFINLPYFRHIFTFARISLDNHLGMVRSQGYQWELWLVHFRLAK